MLMEQMVLMEMDQMGKDTQEMEEMVEEVAVLVGVLEQITLVVVSLQLNPVRL